jgi:hypothetical protein
MKAILGMLFVCAIGTGLIAVLSIDQVLARGLLIAITVVIAIAVFRRLSAA